jgi:putative hemolysin
MTLGLLIAATALASLATWFFSSLTYSLRDFSRSRLADAFEKRGKQKWLESTVEHQSDLVFVTAVFRLVANILVLISVLSALERYNYSGPVQYVLAVIITGVITLFVSVAIPHAISRHAGEGFIAVFIGPMQLLRVLMTPFTKLMHFVDRVVGQAAGASDEPQPKKIEQEIEKEILSVVEEGEKEGVVDEEERQMITRVIEFHNTQAGQIMTARPEIFGIEVDATLEQVKSTIAASGHSRIPVYDDDLDHIVGVLYARDQLRFLGESAQGFSVRQVMRPAMFVPKTKPVQELLRDFRLQKVHIAIVLDEYGGTAGLVTIEDIFEELVGDISDEHEPAEPAMLKQIDDHTWEADARVYIGELNRVIGLSLSEDAGYETLGGFVSTTLSRIPQVGATFEHGSAKFTILDAEPQKVNRVKIELIPVAASQVQDAAAASGNGR